jgi:heme exporter protein CcmD
MSSHEAFIAAAFGLTLVIVVGMVAALVLDHRALRKALARFPSRMEGEG